MRAVTATSVVDLVQNAASQLSRSAAVASFSAERPRGTAFLRYMTKFLRIKNKVKIYYLLPKPVSGGNEHEDAIFEVFFGLM